MCRGGEEEVGAGRVLFQGGAQRGFAGQRVAEDHPDLEHEFALRSAAEVGRGRTYMLLADQPERAQPSAKAEPLRTSQHAAEEPASGDGARHEDVPGTDQSVGREQDQNDRHDPRRAETSSRQMRPPVKNPNREIEHAESA